VIAACLLACSKHNAKPLLHKCVRSNVLAKYTVFQSAKVAVPMAQTFIQRYSLASCYHEIRKSGQWHRSSTIARRRKGRVWVLNRGSHWKHFQQSSASAIH